MLCGNCSEFFWLQVKRFSEFHFTAKFWVFKLKNAFQSTGGGRKKTLRHFFWPHSNLPEKIIVSLFGFLPTFYPQNSSILTEVMGENKKTLTVFSSLTKILWSFFHKTASQRRFRCFLPLLWTLPQPPRHAPINAKISYPQTFTTADRKFLHL